MHAPTSFCTGAVDDMLEILVNTAATTARLEALWSTTCVAWDTTDCSCAVTFTTFCVVTVSWHYEYKLVMMRTDVYIILHYSVEQTDLSLL